MKAQRLAAAHRIAAKLANAERKVAEAAGEVAELNALTYREWAASGLPIHYAQEAMDKAAAAYQAALAARRAMIETHDAFATLRDQAGLGAYAIGDWGQKAPSVQADAGATGIAHGLVEASAKIDAAEAGLASDAA